MLSSKIDRKALLFLKQIARKEKKANRESIKGREDNSEENGSSCLGPQTVVPVPASNQEESSQSQPVEGDGSGLIIGKSEEVVTVATLDEYQSYSNILDSTEEIATKIKEIVKDETSSPLSSPSVSMEPDMVTIAPKRGQVHRLVGRCPELATDVCDFCGYKSSKEGVLRHKQRRHPKTVYKCQVCSAGFGVRYDMRRHRLNHFTPSGQLNKRGQRLWVKNHPDVDPDHVNYRDFEENFVCENLASSKISEHTNDRTDVATDGFSRKNHIPGDNFVRNKDLLGTSDQQGSSVEDSAEKSDVAQRTGAGQSQETESKGLTDSLKHALRTSTTEPVVVHIPPKTQGNNKLTRKKNVPRYPPKDTSRVDCPVCKQNFPQKVLAVHMKVHTEKPPMVCPYCTVEFTERCKMNVHIRAKHQNDYMCKLCGKVLSSSTGLKYHIQGAHSDKVVCLLCQKKLSNQQSLYIHMTREHGNQWKHTCSQCGKRFFDRRSLQYHVVSHMDADVQEEEKKHKCAVCGKGFLRKQTLMLHQNTHVGMKPFRCELCNKGFAFGSLLTKHMKVHSEVREYQCPFCHKAFKFACKLKYHMIIHTKERKHVCGNCDKIFTTSTGLRKHVCKSLRMYKQSGIKLALRAPPDMYSSYIDPYEDFQHQSTENAETLYLCGICNMAFVSLDHVNSHVQTHEEVSVVIESTNATYIAEDLHKPTVIHPEGMNLEIKTENALVTEGQHPDGVMEASDTNYHTGHSTCVKQDLNEDETAGVKQGSGIEGGVLGEWVIEDGVVQCIETTIVGEETSHL